MEKVLTDLDRVNIAKQEYELGSQLDTLVKIMSQDIRYSPSVKLLTFKMEAKKLGNKFIPSLQMEL